MLNISYKSIFSVFFLSLCGLATSTQARATPIQFGTSFYDFIAARDISWQDAQNAASNSTFLGVNGYLATITSQEENNFIFEQFSGFSDFSGAWIGGKVDASGTGLWVTGPETGQIFSQGNIAVSGAYANWGGIEPNDRPSAAFINIGTAFCNVDGCINSAEWADAGNGVSTSSNGNPIKGFLVEYSVVPIPATAFLFAPALLGFMGLRRKAKELMA